MDTEDLKDSLREEVRLLGEFAAGQKRLQELIGKRQWARLEKEVGLMTQLAARTERVEDRRARAYQRLKESLGMADAGAREPGAAASMEAGGFDRVVSRLSAGDRDELFALYRKLKLAVIRVKSNAGLLGYYMRSLSDTLRGVLEELFPHRKGRIYSRSGKTRESSDESLVLYRHI